MSEQSDGADTRGAPNQALTGDALRSYRDEQYRRFQRELRELITSHPDFAKKKIELIRDSFSQGTWDAAVSMKRPLLPTAKTVSAIINKFDASAASRWLNYHDRVTAAVAGKQGIQVYLKPPSSPADPSPQTPMTDGGTDVAAGESDRPEAEVGPGVNEDDTAKSGLTEEPSVGLREALETTAWGLAHTVMVIFRRLKPRVQRLGNWVAESAFSGGLVFWLMFALVISGGNFAWHEAFPARGSATKDDVTLYVGAYTSENQQVPDGRLSLDQGDSFDMGIVIQNLADSPVNGGVLSLDFPTGVRPTGDEAQVFLSPSEPTLYGWEDLNSPFMTDRYSIAPYEGDYQLDLGSIPANTTVVVRSPVQIANDGRLWFIDIYLYDEDQKRVVAASIEMN